MRSNPVLNYFSSEYEIRKAKGNYSCNFVLNNRSCAVPDHWETTRCKEGRRDRRRGSGKWVLPSYVAREREERARSYVSRNFPRGTDPFNVRLSITVRSNMSEVGWLHIGIFIYVNQMHLLALSDFLLRKYHILQILAHSGNTNVKHEFNAFDR